MKILGLTIVLILALTVHLSNNIDSTTGLSVKELRKINS